MRLKGIILAAAYLSSCGQALAAKMECPARMTFDDKIWALIGGDITLGEGFGPEIGSPLTVFGHGRGKYTIDLTHYTDNGEYYPKYLICDYGDIAYRNKPAAPSIYNRRHAIVMVPDDVKECVRIWHDLGHTTLTESIHCRRPDGTDDGAEVFPSEPLSADTEIGGYRLHMTQDQALAVAHAGGLPWNAETRDGENVMTIAASPDGYPMRVTFSSTTATVRQITVIDPSGDSNSTRLLFTFIRRFGWGSPSGGEKAKGYIHERSWHEHDDNKSKIALLYWVSPYRSHGPKEMRLVDLADPGSADEIPKRD